MAQSQTIPKSASTPVNTLDDLLGRLERDPRLDALRRRDYQGAVRTACKVLARPAHAIPGDPREIDR